MRTFSNEQDNKVEASLSLDTELSPIETFLSGNFRSLLGLMGPAHAATGGGFGILLVALFPSIIPLSDGASFVQALAFVILLVSFLMGAALVPDFDGTTSTAINKLGFFGRGISSVFRGSSYALQSMFRSKSERGEKIDPHRGFWHSLIGALFLSFALYVPSTLTASVSIPALGETTVGTVWVALVSSVMFYIYMAGIVVGQLFKKNKEIPFVSNIVTFIASFILVFLLVSVAPIESTSWMFFAMFLGMVIHIIGDCMTTSGAPLFAFLAFPFKGKVWWMTRIPPGLKAKNEGFNNFMILLGVIAGLIGVVLILGSV